MNKLLILAGSWVLVGAIASVNIIAKLFFLMHWPFSASLINSSNTILLISLALLVVLLMVIKGKPKTNKPASTFYIVLGVISALLVFTTIAGLLFKIMHWAGWSVILILSLSSWAIVIPAFCIKKAIDTLSKEKLSGNEL